jgi:hypothetical protein
MINITQEELNSFERDFNTKISANDNCKKINNGIVIPKDIGMIIFENEFKNKNKNNVWKPNSEEVSMIKTFLEKFNIFDKDGKTCLYVRCGKIKFKLRYCKHFKIFKSKTGKDIINKEYFRFFRNEHIFKAILYDIINQFQEYFPNLKFIFKAEKHSKIESQYHKRKSECFKYDSLISIITENRYVELGYEFDERSHDSRRENDKKRNIVANNTLYDFKICKEIFEEKNSNYYHKYFKNVINNIFEICCVLTKNKELLCIKFIVDKCINDENYKENIDEHIEGIENYFNIKKNNNLYKLAYLFNTEPEELYEHITNNNIYLKFQKKCDCDITEPCDCNNCNLDNDICSQEEICICKWNINNNISTIINKLPNDTYLNLDRYKDYIGIASEQLEIASDRIIELQDDKVFSLSNTIPEFVNYVRN